MQRGIGVEHLYGRDLAGTDDGEVGAVARPERMSIEDLYRVHAPEARRLAYLLTGSREVAEDLTQDAFIKVIGKLAHLRDQDAAGNLTTTTLPNGNAITGTGFAAGRRIGAMKPDVLAGKILTKGSLYLTGGATVVDVLCRPFDE